MYTVEQGSASPITYYRILMRYCGHNVFLFSHHSAIMPTAFSHFVYQNSEISGDTDAKITDYYVNARAQGRRFVCVTCACVRSHVRATARGMHVVRKVTSARSQLSSRECTIGLCDIIGKD